MSALGLLFAVVLGAVAVASFTLKSTNPNVGAVVGGVAGIALGVGIMLWLGA